MIKVCKIVSCDEIVNVCEPLVFEHNSVVYLKLFVDEFYVNLATSKKVDGSYSYSFQIRIFVSI